MLETSALCTTPEIEWERTVVETDHRKLEVLLISHLWKRGHSEFRSLRNVRPSASGSWPKEV